MVRIKQSIVARGAGVEFELADQPGFHKRMQSVINRGARRADPAFIQSGPKVVNGSMVGMAQQIVEHGDPLRRAAQTSGGKRFLNPGGCQLIRHRSKIRRESNQTQG